MSDKTTALAKDLPEYIPSGKGSPNYKLLDVIGKTLDTTDEHLADISDAVHIQTADTTAKLFAHGDMVGVYPADNEPLSTYKTRVIAQFSLITTEGTIGDLISTVADIFNTDAENIDYSEPSESGVVMLGIGSRALNQLELTTGEVSSLLNQNVAASHRVELLTVGTYEPVTPSDYNFNNHDPDLGYDGLDGSGNPIGNGGTYAGSI